MTDKRKSIFLLHLSRDSVWMMTGTGLLLYPALFGGPGAQRFPWASACSWWGIFAGPGDLANCRSTYKLSKKCLLWVSFTCKSNKNIFLDYARRAVKRGCAGDRSMLLWLISLLVGGKAWGLTKSPPPERESCDQMRCARQHHSPLTSHSNGLLRRARESSRNIARFVNVIMTIFWRIGKKSIVHEYFFFVKIA